MKNRRNKKKKKIKFSEIKENYQDSKSKKKYLLAFALIYQNEKCVFLFDFVCILLCEIRISDLH